MMKTLIAQAVITGLLFQGGAARGNIDFDQIKVAARKGFGKQFQMFGGGSTTSGDIAVYDANGNVIDGGVNATIHDIGVTFDGGGSALTAATRCRQVDYGGTIKQFTMIADVSGNATVKVETVAYGSYTGTASASDISSGGETMTGAIKAQDSTLSGWTTALSANTVVCFALSSPATSTWLAANIKVQ